MSEENVELVRQAEEAILRRDRDAWFAIHDEDFEIVPVRDWPEGAVRGREAGLGLPHEDPRQLRVGSRSRSSALMPGPTKSWSIRGTTLRGAGSGAEVELDQWFVATVREGKILRVQWFTDGVEAREAAGLSE